MMPAAIPRVKRTLSQIALSEAQTIARATLNLAMADDVEQFVAREFAQRWPQLFNTNDLPCPAATSGHHPATG
jgi:signal transduction protein with GAF and PtsI domain